VAETHKYAGCCHPWGMHLVVGLALPAVVVFDLAIASQVFGHRDEQQRYAFTTASLVPGGVPTTSGYAVQACHGLRVLADADTVVLPGYAPRTLPADPVLQALRAAAGRGARIVSVCTGAFALAAAGLLDGHRATTHWRDAAEFAARHPTIKVDPDVLYIDVGPVPTSAGVAAGIDLCLHLVRLTTAPRSPSASPARWWWRRTAGAVRRSSSNGGCCRRCFPAGVGRGHLLHHRRALLGHPLGPGHPPKVHRRRRPVPGSHGRRRGPAQA